MRTALRKPLGLTALLLVAALLPLLTAGAGSEAPLRPDPLPLRRILVSPGRVAAELERARQGVLVKLPRAEFEARLLKAARTCEQAASTPRLARAAYTARLEGNVLVGGGDWTIVNSGPGAAVLPLPDFNLALRKLTLDDPAAGAVLGELDGKTLGLLVPRVGKQSVFFDWSRRGGQGGTDLHFDLQVPVSPVAALELTLPADRTVAVSRGAALVAGPHEATDNRHRVWRLQFAGRARVELVVRGPDGPGRLPPLLLAQLNTTQQLTPQHQLARYAFQVEALHAGVRELVFEYDAPLEPYDVTVDRAELEGWEKQKNQHTLTVRLREPFQGPLQPLRLTVLCQAPLFKDRNGSTWTSPGMRLRGATTQSETLRLQVNPDVRLESWKAGAFRLVKTGASLDGAQLLTLVDGGAGAVHVARPSAAVKAHGAEAYARQLTWWRVGPEGSTLTAEVTYEVTRGSLFRLPLRTTPDWEVEEIRLEPKGLLGGWAPVVGKAGLLLVELQQALTTGEKAKLTVRLRSARGRKVPAAGLTLPFPDLEPLDVRLREGTFAVGIDPFYQATAVQVSHAGAAPGENGPWGRALPNYAYLFRGKSVTGQLRLSPHRVRFSARCSSDVFFASGRATLVARLQLEPIAGSLASVDIALSAATADPRKWRSEGLPNLVREARRLPALEAAPRLLALGTRDPLNALALLAAAPGGERWRLTLARPLTQRETVTLEANLKEAGGPRAGGDEQRWDVPLLTVPGADRMEGEVALHLLGTELRRVDAAAVRESGRDTAPPLAARGAGPVRQESWRLFHYGPALFPGRLPALHVLGRTLAMDRSPREVCDRSELTTYAEPRGRLLHHFRFRVWNWRQRELPVLLPVGVKLLAAKAEGRWLDRVGQRETSAGLKVELPVPAGAEPHSFELVYGADGAWAVWAPWARLTAPAPKLPVPPISFHRTWRLPPGARPLTRAARRLPDALGPRDREPWWAPLGRAWLGGRSWLGAVAPELAPEAWAAAQRLALAGAEGALRHAQPREAPWRLGDALERLTLTHARQFGPLVVDATALRAADVHPSSEFTPSPNAGHGMACLFEGLGLTYLPCRPAMLLTTRRQVKLWEAAADHTAPAAGAIGQAVAEAAAHGRDSSGRFQTVANWLAREAPTEALPAGPGDGPPLPGADSFGPTWTEWEGVAGGPDDVLLIVRQGGVRTLGLTLAGLFCLLAWRARRALARRWRLRLLTLWLAVAGLALFWLPPALSDAAWWPALAGCGAALVAYLRPAVQGSTPRRGRAGNGTTEQLLGAGAASVALALLLAALPTGAPAALPVGQEPYTVLLLPADAPQGENVLVGPDLLKKLDDLGRRGRGPARGPVLLAAEYAGQLVGDRAEFTADFQVYCPSEEGILTVPLAGVELKPGSLWAGARVYPVAAPAGQPGFTVRLKRGGPPAVNTLRLAFSVRLPAAGESRELRFTAPRLPQSRLVLALPPGTQSAQVVSGLGRQALHTAGGPRLEADLGREGAVLVRWRGPPGPRRPLALELRETYFWDLRSAASTLTAVLRYTVTAGTATSFTVGLPEGLDLRSVDVAQVGAAPAGTAPARLKGTALSVKGGNRQLTVELYTPAAGEVQLTLGLLPRLAARPDKLRLHLPTPQAGVKTLEGTLAYRVEGLVPSGNAPGLTVQAIDPDTFVQAWQRLGMREAVRPTDAYRFGRKQRTAALDLTLTAPRVEARQEIGWRVHAQHADFEAALEASSAGNLMLLEWEISAQVHVSRVAGVGGTPVRFWSRTDNRLQVWLAQPATKVAVQVQGWLPYPRPASGRAGRFLLPCVRLRSAEPSPNLVRVAASPELLIEPEREAQFLNLRRLSEPEGTPLSYRAVQPQYRAEFLFRPSPVAPHVRSLTCAEVRDGALTCTAHLDLRVPHGELRTVTVRLRNGDDDVVRLEAPGAVLLREQRGKGGERSWTLTLPPGVTRQYAARVTATAPLKAGGRLVLPEVTVDGAASEQRWLAVLGLGVRGEGGQGLAPVKDAAVELRPWPAEAERVRREGTAWKVVKGDGGLRLTPRPAAAAPSVQVLYAEQQAAVTDLRRWTHQATYWLHAGSGADLQMALPRGARVVAAAVDGTAVSPRQPEPDVLSLPLSGGEAVRVLRLRWVYADGAETLEAPNLEAPRFKEAPTTAVLWRVDVPAGYRLGRVDPAASGRPAGAAAAELGRAEAQVWITTLLAERLRAAPSEATRAQLRAAQQSFFRHCHRAANLLATPGGAVAGPAGLTLTDWLRDLRQRNSRLGRGMELDKIPAVAEKQPRAPDADEGPAFFALPERGLPTYWYAAASAAAPRLRLTAFADDRRGEAILSTELLGGALVGAWIISCLPGLLTWLRRLLPEQMVLLAWLGWQAFGFSLLGGVLIVTGVCARIVLLGSWLQRVFRRQRNEAAAGSSFTST